MKTAMLALILTACAKKAPSSNAAGSETGTAETGTTETGQTHAFEATDLAGAWGSGCVDPGSGQGIALDFDLTAGDWVLDYQAFGDATCALPFLTVHIEGPYTLGSDSSIVDGAREAEFAFHSKTVTPHSEDAVAFLENTCGGDFTAGEAADLSAGCAGLGQKPLADCDRDYDVVSLVGDTVRFGSRPVDNDLCTPEKRPTELSAMALTAR
jgi:hypothetical protein